MREELSQRLGLSEARVQREMLGDHHAHSTPNDNTLPILCTSFLGTLNSSQSNRVVHQKEELAATRPVFRLIVSGEKTWPIQTPTPPPPLPS
uniref:(California timema) hypothetical protein n=1 Tax=Timema californicum TaxID=61474 RepID=A0A7R9JHD1_TIMCA|nr:unnamed protein product [Timema californicum]